jgi:biopolymer transport protein ExbD
LTPPRADDEDELEMTPMIDVTFLLLIFFMVSSTVSQFASLQLPEANTGDAENPETRVVLVLDFPDGGNDASAEKFQGGQPILLADARLRLSNSQELLDAATLEERLRTSFQEQGKTQLILQAHRKMPASVVREVLNIGRRAGAVKTLVGVSVAK